MGSMSAAYENRPPSNNTESLSDQISRNLDMITSKTFSSVVDLSNEEFELMQRSFMSTLGDVEQSTNALLHYFNDMDFYEDWAAALLAATDTGLECGSSNVPTEFMQIKHALSGVLMSIQLFHIIADKASNSTLIKDTLDARSRSELISEARDRVAALHNGNKYNGLLKTANYESEKVNISKIYLERMNFISPIILFFPAWSVTANHSLNSQLRNLIASANAKGTVSMMPDAQRLIQFISLASRVNFDISNVSLQLIRWTK